MVQNSISLANSKDIVVNSAAVIEGNRLIDLAEPIDAIQGLAPETLNSSEKLASPFNGDSKYFQPVATSISDKADKSTTCTKTQADVLLDAKVDDAELTNNHYGDDLHKNGHRQIHQHH